MRYLPIGLIMAVLFFVPCAIAKGNPDCFACNSSHFMLQDFEKQPVVRSEDGVKSVLLTKEYTFKVMYQRAVLREFTFGDMSANIEVGWSPDSKQFFISYSDGGAVGNYHVHLY